MVNDIKTAIAMKLNALYPACNVYDEDVPQNFKTPSFMIILIEQDYNKRLNSKYKSLLSFDIGYFSDKEDNETKNDCYEVGLNLLRGFDLINGLRVLDKRTTINNNILHFIFNINYSEMKVEESEKMQELEEVNTNI